MFSIVAGVGGKSFSFKFSRSLKIKFLMPLEPSKCHGNWIFLKNIFCFVQSGRGEILPGFWALEKNNCIQYFTILCKSWSALYHKKCMYVTWCVSLTAFLNILKIWNWRSSETIVMKSCVPGYMFFYYLANWCLPINGNTNWEYH